MSANKFVGDFVSLEITDSTILVKITKKACADDFARMEFHSRLLHSLAPDSNSFWRLRPRLNCHIKGWPRSIQWRRNSTTDFTGTISSGSQIAADRYGPELNEALRGIRQGEPSPYGSSKFIVFEIGDGDKYLKYKFLSKARTIAVLCVLYDLKPHGRNVLEINIPNNLRPQLAIPFKFSDSTIKRHYGDPSKTADVLRNEGWPRQGEEAGMKVFRKNVQGSQQQMYQLLKREQNLSSQVQRTNISQRWRNELYKQHNYTCQICHFVYPEYDLAPDHRIPVIFQADSLTEQNYKQKLMALCRFCNQQKREFCKRIPHGYDWATSPWAYPEKFELGKLANEIKTYAATNKLSISETLKTIADCLSRK
ncbi:MAG: HNH endonuclease signature motif containing protein [Candidatus Aminicenantales bacterium]|jgi:hypothetical protein